MTAFVTKILVTILSQRYSEIPLQSECSAWFPLSPLLHQEDHFIKCHCNRKILCLLCLRDGNANYFHHHLQLSCHQMG